MGGPILRGGRGVLESRIQSLTLRLDLDREVEVVDPEQDARYDDYSANYHAFMGRRGVSPARARTVVRTNTTVIAALMVAKGDADALIAGTVGPYRTHLVDVVNVLGLREGVITPAALSALILPRGTVFVADPYVVPNPSVEQLADITELAAEEVRRFGIEPKVAMLSHSNFGTMNDADALRMRDAVALVKQRLPDLEVDGEMHADAALVPELRAQYLPDSVLNGPANLLIMPDMDAANITFNLFKVLEDCVTIGPMLLGVHKPAHICTPSATTRGIVNLAAVACVDAQIAAQRGVTGIGHHQGYNPLRTWIG